MKFRQRKLAILFKLTVLFICLPVAIVLGWKPESKDGSQQRDSHILVVNSTWGTSAMKVKTPNGPCYNLGRSRPQIQRQVLKQVCKYNCPNILFVGSHQPCACEPLCPITFGKPRTATLYCCFVHIKVSRAQNWKLAAVLSVHALYWLHYVEAVQKFWVIFQPGTFLTSCTTVKLSLRLWLLFPDLPHSIHASNYSFDFVVLIERRLVADITHCAFATKFNFCHQILPTQECQYWMTWRYNWTFICIHAICCCSQCDFLLFVNVSLNSRTPWGLRRITWCDLLMMQHGMMTAALKKKHHVTLHTVVHFLSSSSLCRWNSTGDRRPLWWINVVMWL